jgi:hypothetical protein
MYIQFFLIMEATSISLPGFQTRSEAFRAESVPRKLNPRRRIITDRFARSVFACMGDTVDREEGKVNPLEVGICLPGGGHV